MKEFFFSGSAEAKLDEKNRFVLPKQMRFGLVEGGKLEFTLGLALGGCLAIYKQSDIDLMAQKFRENLYLAKYQKFFTLFFSTLYPSTCDDVGRTTIPNRLKELVKIQREIVVAGVLNHIEIWPKELYDRQFIDGLHGEKGQLETLSQEAFALLHEQRPSQQE